MKDVIPKWKRPTGKYVLKIGYNAWFLKAGSYDDGAGVSPACAQTTPHIMEAMGFETQKRAEMMRRLLITQYGLESRIVERKVRT